MCLSWLYFWKDIFNVVFLRTLFIFSEPLGLIYPDLLELPTLSYSKYKYMIIFFNDYSSYCNIAFLYKKSEATDVAKSIF